MNSNLIFSAIFFFLNPEPSVRERQRESDEYFGWVSLLKSEVFSFSNAAVMYFDFWIPSIPWHISCVLLLLCLMPLLLSETISLYGDGLNSICGALWFFPFKHSILFFTERKSPLSVVNFIAKIHTYWSAHAYTQLRTSLNFPFRLNMIFSFTPFIAKLFLFIWLSILFAILLDVSV